MDEVPLCKVCNHHHVQGVTCHICGHKGRGKVFQEFEMNMSVQPTNPHLHFRGYSYDPNLSEFKLMRIVRQRLFTTSPLRLNPIIPTLSLEEEFDSFENASSRYLLGYIGDAPIAFGRWRVLTLDHGTTVYALIDRLGVLESKRQRGVGVRTLEAIVEDVQTQVESHKLPIDTIWAYVPVMDARGHNSTVGAWNVFTKHAGFSPSDELQHIRHQSCVKMTRPLR